VPTASILIDCETHVPQRRLRHRLLRPRHQLIAGKPDVLAPSRTPAAADWPRARPSAGAGGIDDEASTTPPAIGSRAIAGSHRRSRRRL